MLSDGASRSVRTGPELGSPVESVYSVNFMFIFAIVFVVNLYKNLHNFVLTIFARFKLCLFYACCLLDSRQRATNMQFDVFRAISVIKIKEGEDHCASGCMRNLSRHQPVDSLSKDLLFSLAGYGRVGSIRTAG
jgi:hypothetical protein